MAWHYTLKSFIRKINREHLKSYLEQNELQLSIDFISLKKSDVEPICEAISMLNNDKVDMDFRNIALMASNEGNIKTLIDEALYFGIELHQELEKQDTVIDKSFWAFLTYRDIFENAMRFVSSSSMSNRYWRKKLSIPPLQYTDISNKISELEQALKNYLVKQEGRGRECKIDYLNRDDRHYFYAYPEDFARNPLVWKKNSLGREVFHPAFEIVFVLHQAQNALDIYFQGQGNTVKDLRALFASVICNVDQLPEDTKPAFELAELMSRKFSFAIPTGSPIQKMRVKSLSVIAHSTPKTKLMIEPTDDDHPEAVYRSLDRFLPANMRDITRVIGARIQATIDNGDGKKPKSHTFDISTRSCSLKHEGNDQLLRDIIAASGLDSLNQVETPYASTA